MSSPPINALEDNASTKDVAKLLKWMVDTVLRITPSDCVVKNYDNITQRAISTFKELLPEYAPILEVLLPRIIDAQREVRKLFEKGTPTADEYIVAYNNKFLKYHMDAGIYSVLAALQAMHAAQICGEESARYFLARTLMGGTIIFETHRLLMAHLGLTPEFTANLIFAFLEEAK